MAVVAVDRCAKHRRGWKAATHCHRCQELAQLRKYWANRKGKPVAGMGWRKGLFLHKSA